MRWLLLVWLAQVLYVQSCQMGLLLDGRDGLLASTRASDRGLAALVMRLYSCPVCLPLWLELLLHARRPLSTVETADEVSSRLLVLASAALQEILVLS